jgi:Cytochrome c oxidase assembly protein PET191
MLECLKDPIASDECRAVRNQYSMCKHSQLNMRTRIRGVRTY